MTWLYKVQLCKECEAEPNNKMSVSIHKCSNCGRIACSDLIGYIGASKGYECRPDVGDDPESCTEYVPEEAVEEKKEGSL